MWIVELALRRPHTFIVMAISIAIFGVMSMVQMAVDIFPVIDVPIVSCVWTYTGMSPYYVENLVTTVTEQWLTSTVNGIEHMESQSVSGLSIIKVYLHKGSDIGEAVAMVTSVGNAVINYLPPGITPPFVTVSSATDVPVLQLQIGSKTMSEAELFDVANNFVRNQLATIQGATIPFPYGGKYRSVMIDLDPQALIANGLSAYEVVSAVNSQSIIAPSGTAKIGSYEYIMTLNNTPSVLDNLNGLPIKSQKGAVVFLKDVAHVRDGYQPQLNIVNEDGRRAVLFNILKNGDASTLSVVNQIKEKLPRMQQVVPPACKISILTDQSIFVKECVSEVVREAITAAGLTALMMLALLGSWRSTLIVATSIPLAMFCSVIGLHICGQSINSMTLGGLALAVGMLVDDATVEIENLHRNLDMGKQMENAILDSAREVATPALVSTFSICIVFVPLIFLTEPSRSLFVPLGMAVVFAMLASYGLSRTIVPLMCKALLSKEHEQKSSGAERKTSVFGHIYHFIDEKFEAARNSYKGILHWALSHPKTAVSMFLGFYGVSLFLLPAIGEDFFPAIDAGVLRLHVSARPGTRVEETERIFHRVENAIRKLIPKDEIVVITDNIGMPVSGVNYAFSDSQTISEADGEIAVVLTEDRPHSTGWYQKQVRAMLTHDFPEVTYYFQPADIVSQILNAGLPAPIDIRITGLDPDKNYKIAQDIKRDVAKIPGTVDVCLHQVVDAPQFVWDVDRTRANQMGITQRDVSNSLLISLSSSFQVAPNFWLNQKNGVNYNLAAQTPQYRISSLDQMRLTAISPSQQQQLAGQSSSSSTQGSQQGTGPAQPELLMNLAQQRRTGTPSVVSHYNVQPAFDVYAACQDRDLGGVARDIKAVLKKYDGKLPRGSVIQVAGQVESMISAFEALLGGLVFAVVLVYLLLVVNFQSWSDPLIILMAIPGAFCGILWSLFVTQTTFSIPALMGTIMTIGVASANSILMVTFANEQRAEGYDGFNSALNAGYQRFRPVIMTATAMIIGMIPMAIGAGQGGSQNAPIGRAVIGGLTVATFSTLLFVPLIFSLLRKSKAKSALKEPNHS
ncbi:MAG: efflux RND transporter permease subunit [Candidatus Obscuribacterales bacterium]|nr:efflux RND transporter permease subunit [Candidatus Obscuribacterales bacterium]